MERLSAAEALINSKTNIEWETTLQALQTNRSGANKRLILEIISYDRGEHFTEDQIAQAILDYQKPSADEEDEGEIYVSGIDYRLVKHLTPSRSALVLDCIAQRLVAARRPRHQPIANILSTTIHRLITKVLDGEINPAAARFWLWLSALNGAQGYSKNDRERISTFLSDHETLRHDIQRLAFPRDETEGAWMVIAHDLPQASSALSLSRDDTIFFVKEICTKEELSKADTEVWTVLVRS